MPQSLRPEKLQSTKRKRASRNQRITGLNHRDTETPRKEKIVFTNACVSVSLWYINATEANECWCTPRPSKPRDSYWKVAVVGSIPSRLRQLLSQLLLVPNVIYHMYAMKRTTIFADEDLLSEVREISEKEKKSIAEVMREAMRTYVRKKKPKKKLSFIAIGRSGRRDIAERHESLLWKKKSPHE